MYICTCVRFPSIREKKHTYCFCAFRRLLISREMKREGTFNRMRFQHKNAHHAHWQAMKKSENLWIVWIQEKKLGLHKFIYSVKWNANELNGKCCGRFIECGSEIVCPIHCGPPQNSQPIWNMKMLVVFYSMLRIMYDSSIRNVKCPEHWEI